MDTMAPEFDKGLPVVHRYISTHNASGIPSFETGTTEEILWDKTPLGGDMSLVYTATSFPVPLAGDADLKQYQEHLVNKPTGFMIPNGAIVRYVDYLPGEFEPLWHRTITVDFGILIEGELELELEGGEKRIMKRGDVAVQRGTNHCWRNPSKTHVARAIYISMAATSPVVNGQSLAESLGKVAH